jgi:hypothetical protein
MRRSTWPPGRRPQVPSRPEPSNESERPSDELSEENRALLEDVREHLVWQKVYRERIARQRQTSLGENPPSRPPEE